MINKNWTLSVTTPFGIEDYNMVVDQLMPCVSGKIFSHKGEMIFENGKLINDEIEIESVMEYPIFCKINIKGNIKDNSIAGYIFVDEYLRVPFKGEF
jgi:hypothetical protein